MLETRRQPDFTEKPLGAHAGGDLRAEDLDGHGPIVPEVAGEVHRGHAPAAELPLEAVTAGEAGLEGGGEAGQATLLWGGIGIYKGRGWGRCPQCLAFAPSLRSG